MMPNTTASLSPTQKSTKTMKQSQNLTLTNTVPVPKKPFIGRLQPVVSRLPAKPAVNFEKGGSDFRCPNSVTCFGKQTLSGTHRRSQGRVTFSRDTRFKPSDTCGPGPAAFGQASSLKKQTDSRRRSAESTSFGTSDRDGALKLYTVYTYKKN